MENRLQTNSLNRLVSQWVSLAGQIGFAIWTSSNISQKIAIFVRHMAFCLIDDTICELRLLAESY